MNKKQIISALNSLYTSRRSRAQSLAFANLQRARQNADFCQVEKEIKQVVFDLGKAQAEGKSSKGLAAKLAELQKKQAEILKTLNMTAADLEPNYKCKICQDQGRIGSKLCDCYKKELYSLLLENSGARSNLADFSQFDEKLITNSTQLEQLKKIKAAFTKWVNMYPKVSTHTFLLCGPTGVGKSFITECITSEMLKRGHLVSYISATGLVNNFMKYHTTFDENKNSFYDIFVEPELLVIDDLGTEPIFKNVTLNYLCALLNDRFEKRKITIITTNLSPEGILRRYGDRIFSRIVNKFDSAMYKIDGDDLRLKRR